MEHRLRRLEIPRRSNKFYDAIALVLKDKPDVFITTVTEITNELLPHLPGYKVRSAKTMIYNYLKYGVMRGYRFTKRPTYCQIQIERLK